MATTDSPEAAATTSSSSAPETGTTASDDFTDGEDRINLIGLGISSKREVLDRAYAWDEGTGVHIDLTPFGGGRIDLRGFNRDDFDASDFLL